MIGRRTLWELFHVALGVGVACFLAWICGWAYPLARTDFWIVAGAAMAAFTVMSVPTIRRAIAEDRADNAARLSGEGR